VSTPRLAILTTFEGDLPFTARHPDDGAKVSRALAPHLPGWAFDTWRVSQGHWPADTGAYAGFVITGSPASVNDHSPWIVRLERLVRTLHAHRRPLVGLCFGHQLVAKALGGEVGLSPGGWRVGTAPLPLHWAPAWLHDAPPVLTLYAVHNEQVLVPPPGARVVGGDAFCPAASLALGEHVWTLQYHPEFSPAFMADLLEALDGELPAELLAHGREQIARPADGPQVMAWIARFLQRAATAA
jgi:GMP synthase-like glutamine amidotransferase